jgi:hypothetical protein
MSPRPRWIAVASLSAVASLALLGSTLAGPIATAAPLDPGLQWSTPASVSDGGRLRASDTQSGLMVAAVLNAGALQIYAARGSDPWSLSATITSDNVGSLTDVDIATDGRGWLLAWSYRRDDGAYGIRRVQADVLGAPLAFRWIIERALNKPSVSVDGVANATAASGTRYLIAVDRTMR